MSVRASASKTPSARWSRDDFIRRLKDPSLPPPPRFEPVRKEPGSFELTQHGLIEVR